MGRKSVRKTALGDQVVALLRERRRCLTTHEIADQLDEHYPSVYQVLIKLAKIGAVEKVQFEELRNVLWGVAGSKLTLAQQLAEERDLRLRLLERLHLVDLALSQGDIVLARERLRGDGPRNKM